METMDMDTSRTDSRRPGIHFGIALLSTAALVLSACASHAPASKSMAAATEQRFATPKEAVDALLAACRTYNEAELVAIFGEQSRPVVSTGDPEADRERCQKLLDAAQQSTRLDPKGPDMLQLVVGTDDWPFPIPLVKDGKTWHFDSADGMQEIARRRIGADELEAIAACRVYAAAQEEYASRSRGRTKVYAQRLASSSGKKDGLYWSSSGGKDASPLGPAAAAAAAGDPGDSQLATWRGYHFHILTAQGGDAPGGKRDYVVDGKMTGGFALVAYPVAYGSTGIMTFVVGSDGRVYEKDLGAQTGEIAAKITEYNPDSTWKPVSG
jgi:hypothetical protein